MKVIASIKQPSPSNGLGYWPAFWMLGAGFRASSAGTSGIMACSKWPSVGEIDALEDVNALSEHSGTLHCGIDPGGPCNESTGLTSGLRPCPGCQAGYHTYSVIVDRTTASNESITWYLDGKAYHTVTERQIGARTWRAAVDHGFFLILDVAIGGGYPNVVCDCATPTASTVPARRCWCITSPSTSTGPDAPRQQRGQRGRPWASRSPGSRRAAGECGHLHRIRSLAGAGTTSIGSGPERAGRLPGIRRGNVIVCGPGPAPWGSAAISSEEAVAEQLRPQLRLRAGRGRSPHEIEIKRGQNAEKNRTAACR